MGILFQFYEHSGAEGIQGEVVSPIQVSYLSKRVSTSRFRICRSLNISLGSEWEKNIFVRSNGRKTIFEWPKWVSEVSFPRFWGVLCIAKCFRFFVSVIGSAVFEISRFARFYVKRLFLLFLPIMLTNFHQDISWQIISKNRFLSPGPRMDRRPNQPTRYSSRIPNSSSSPRHKKHGWQKELSEFRW